MLWCWVQIWSEKAIIFNFNTLEMHIWQLCQKAKQIWWLIKKLHPNLEAVSTKEAALTMPWPRRFLIVSICFDFVKKRWSKYSNVGGKARATRPNTFFKISKILAILDKRWLISIYFLKLCKTAFSPKVVRSQLSWWSSLELFEEIMGKQPFRRLIKSWNVC